MRLAELASALALASDYALAIALESSFRRTLIAMALTRGLPPEDRRVVYYASLLRHLGCTASASAETALMGDDHELKRTLFLADDVTLGLCWRGFAKGRNPFTRAVRVARFMSSASTIRAVYRARCESATTFSRRLGLGERIHRALDQSYERFDGRGQPSGLRGDAITIEARWIALAEAAAFGGVDAVRARRGTQLDPLLCDAFLNDATRILAELEKPLLDSEPNPAWIIDAAGVLAAAEVVADFADVKSTYTVGHSRGVAELAVRAAPALGLSDDRVNELRLAALMHDVGRVAVSNAIWDKRGELDAAERSAIEAHTTATDRILAQLSAKSIGRLASQAHERGDGSGYHRKLSATAIGTASRVLAAADVAHALTQARPHRAAYSRDEASRILIELARAGALDPRAVDAVITCRGTS